MVLRGLLCLVLAAGAVLAFRTATAEPDARFTGNLDIDSVRYDQYARAVADSRSLGAIPPLYPPGFIALLAATYAVAGASYLAAKVVLAALLVGAAVLVAYTTWRVVGPAEAVIAAALTVFSPLMLAYVSTLQYEVSAAFLSALVMALLVGASQRPPPLPLPRAAAIGLACAGAALTREPLALWLPLALFVVLPPERRVRGTKRAAVVALVMAVAFALPIGGWTIVYFGAQRFMVPVYAQVAVLASLPLAVAARWVWARHHLGVALLVVAVWGVFAQQHRFAGSYRLEAESLGGIGSTLIDGGWTAV